MMEKQGRFGKWDKCEVQLHDLTIPLVVAEENAIDLMTNIGKLWKCLGVKVKTGKES